MLETLINKYQGSTQVCRRKDDCDAMVLGGLLKALKAKDLLPLPRPPFRGLSIKTLVGKLQELQLPTLCEKLGVESLGYISPTGFYRNDPGRCGVAQEILNTIIKMEESIKECTLGVQHLPKTKEES